MQKEVLDYLATQRVCVVAVEMSDSSPHTAAVHFSFDPESQIFVIQTNPDSRKAEPLKQNKTTRASLVIGFEEIPGGKDKTFQLDGVAQLVESETELIEKYLHKFPEKRGKWLDDVFFKIGPTWWRFTDWGKPEGKIVFSSEGLASVKGAELS